MKTLNIYIGRNNNKKNREGFTSAIGKYLKIASVLLFIIFVTATRVLAAGATLKDITPPTTQVAAGSICAGQLNIPLYHFYATSTGGTASTLTAFSFTTNGNWTTSDITAFHIYSSNAPIANDNLSLAVLGGTVASSGGGTTTINITGMTMAVPSNSTVYIWITCDVAVGAAAHTISVTGISSTTPAYSGTNTTSPGNTLTVNYGADVSNFATAANSPCLGTAATTTITSTTLISSSTYTVTYTLSGAGGNTGTFNAGMTYGTGSGTFSILSGNLLNTGATTATINSIVSSGGCSASPSTGNVANL
ncbi:MAG: hypothetical protein ACHQD8_00850 [Chitinophagales bacterium]